MNARDRYPLDENEERRLVASMALSQGLLLLIGFAGAIAITGLTSGDWAQTVFGSAWIRSIVSSLTESPAQATVAGAALALVLLALAWTCERWALRSVSGRKAVLATRQGVNGEMPRLPASAIVVLMVLTGFTEELLFRFVLLGLLLYGFSLFVPPLLAAIIAVFVSSFVFWIAHVRYRDFWSSALTLALAVLLNVAYLATGSLLLVAIAHAGYDLVTLFAERRKMVREPDYFHGKIPNRIILNAIEQAQNRGDSDGS